MCCDLHKPSQDAPPPLPSATSPNFFSLSSPSRLEDRVAFSSPHAHIVWAHTNPSAEPLRISHAISQYSGFLSALWKNSNWLRSRTFRLSALRSTGAKQTNNIFILLNWHRNTWEIQSSQLNLLLFLRNCTCAIITRNLVRQLVFNSSFWISVASGFNWLFIFQALHSQSPLVGEDGWYTVRLG